MSHLAFVSYSRINVKFPKDAELLHQFVTDLRNDLEVQAPAGYTGEVCFFDTTNIETGSDWNEELSEAAAQSRVAVAFFSPSYFSSVWCGREFQVFLDRQQQAAVANPAGNAPLSIIPLIWIRHSALPEAAGAIQSIDDSIPGASFPAEYAQIGLRQIMLLQDSAKYMRVRIALGQRILKAANSAQLPESVNLDLRNYRSAWETPPSGAKPASADAVTKTCFVFLANEGWHWRPYPEPQPKVGALAQQVTGEIGLQYEEIPCDNSLNNKLRDTNKRHIPTVLITDPSSWTNPAIKGAMEEYDGRYFINCGLIVPWDVVSPANDGRWRQLTTDVCPQKTKVPPLNHEWTSVSSPEVFKTKTLATIEEIRMRMLYNRAASGTDIAKAENETAAKAAEAQGINLHSAPAITNISSTQIR
jgi:hypothetical protein